MKKIQILILCVLTTMMAMAQSVPDSHFALVGSMSPAPKDFVWTNPMTQGYDVVRGQGWHEGNFQRLPGKAKGIVRKAVWNLSTNSTGLSIVFFTDAPEIRVRYGISGPISMDHMPATGVSGVDLYAFDAYGKMRWCAAQNQRTFGDTIEYRYANISYHADRKKGYEYHLYLPLYAGVTWMEIGVSAGHAVSYLPTTQERPIVIYGTSIAQGACASRPGMAWTNIIQRETGHEVINLGFSGNGTMDPEVFQLMSEIDAKMWVLDNMPNMDGGNQKLIYQRTINGVHILRKKSDAPILLIEHEGFSNSATSDTCMASCNACNVELEKAYKALQAEGVKDLYILTNKENALDMDDMVEGWHPNDLGMRHIATMNWKKMSEILGETCKERTVFSPILQNRDPYTWQERHEQVLKLNRERQPEIVMIGNSITHYWSGEPVYERVHRGDDSWAKLFKGKNVVNMGFGWDRVENVLWRFYHDELDGYKAKKVFLMIGANNLHLNTDSQIVAGVDELVRIIKQHQPQAKIYVAGIMPYKIQMKRLPAYNAMLKASLPSDVTFIDFTPYFTDKDGNFIDAYFEKDGLHPNAEGYRQEAKCLQPYVDE